MYWLDYYYSIYFLHLATERSIDDICFSEMQPAMTWEGATKMCTQIWTNGRVASMQSASELVYINEIA